MLRLFQILLFILGGFLSTVYLMYLGVVSLLGVVTMALVWWLIQGIFYGVRDPIIETILIAAAILFVAALVLKGILAASIFR